MGIRTVAPHERERLLALIDEALRRPGSPTGPRDDFPLALGPGNGEGQFIYEEAGEVVAGLACLVRPFLTSVGEVPVAAIGSVVTAPAHRGRGLSGQLQAALLRGLREGGVPLAVLWSDRPEVYRSRGFAAAGIEYQVGLEAWTGAPQPPRAGLRAYRETDAPAVAALHARHPYRTRRRDGEAAILYAMPGTRGFVLTEDGDGPVSAYAFCGKGQDFPGWVLEWGGQPDRLLALVDRLRATAGARWLLAPQGAETVAARLAQGGALVRAAPSGLWCVLKPEALGETAAWSPPGRDAQAWLGGVDPQGQPRPGPLRLAVWGFDSV